MMDRVISSTSFLDRPIKALASLKLLDYDIISSTVNFLMLFFLLAILFIKLLIIRSVDI